MSEDQERRTSLWEVLRRRAQEATKAASPRLQKLGEETKAAGSRARAFADEHGPEARRVARVAVNRSKRAAEAAKPEVDRLFRTLRPPAEKAVQRAVEYGREHDEEIKHVFLNVTRAAAPRPVQFIVDVMWDDENENREADLG